MAAQPALQLSTATGRSPPCHRVAAAPLSAALTLTVKAAALSFSVSLSVTLTFSLTLTLALPGSLTFSLLQPYFQFSQPLLLLVTLLVLLSFCPRPSLVAVQLSQPLSLTLTFSQSLLLRVR